MTRRAELESFDFVKFTEYGTAGQLVFLTP